MNTHAWVRLAIPMLFLGMGSGVAVAQSPELEIRTDKGGYLLGEAATVRIKNLNECAGKTVALGLRDAARGQRFATKDVTLDETGGGEVRLALLRDNNGSPVSPAAWGSCVARHLEPGLALDPFILLISISIPTPLQLVEFLPDGAETIGLSLIKGDLEHVISVLTPGTVIKTGYPGDGGPIDRETAASEIRGLLAGGSDSDEFGSGRLGLLGVWDINGHYAAPASVIGADGNRRVVALGVSEAEGVWRVSSYGRVVVQTGILETYAEQHRVLLGRVTPRAPDVGNSPKSEVSEGGGTFWPLAFLVTVTILGGISFLRRRLLLGDGGGKGATA